MKKITQLLLCSITFAALCLLNSCNSDRRVASVDPPVVLKLESAEGIEKSIRLICNSKVWNQQYYDSIDWAITSLTAANMLDSRINQDKNLKGLLFASSAVCLEEKVDSVFRTPVYNGYEQMKKDLNFLLAAQKNYIENAVNIDSINKSLSWVSKMFKEYDNRLYYSRKSFGQKVEYSSKLEDYSYNYFNGEKQKYERIIKDNKDNLWNTYFRNNTEINNGLKAFSVRLEKCRVGYYVKLEEAIEIRFNEAFKNEDERKVFTPDTLYDKQQQYNKITKSIKEKDAIANSRTRLNEYRNKYTQDYNDWQKEMADTMLVNQESVNTNPTFGLR